MIYELFNYLHPTDLTACSMVNKRWHWLYSGFKLPRLVIGDDPSHFYFPKSGFSSEKIENQEIFYPKTFDHLADQPLLSNLKCLVLCGVSPKFDLGKVNEFKTLVHLIINVLYLPENLKLNLPKLEVLIFCQSNGYTSLSVDCPKLNELIYYEVGEKNLLDLKHPESIKKLNTNLGSKLTSFKNVECLFTQEFALVSKSTLRSLPRLTELHFEKNLNNFKKFEIGMVKQKLKEFMDNLAVLGQPGFKFRFAGFQLNKISVDQLDFGVQEGSDILCLENEYVYTKNRQLIDPDCALSFIRTVNYTRLMNLVTGELPSYFTKQLTCVEEVKLFGAIQNANHLLSFLKSMRALKNLIINGSQLLQEFFDQLPISAKSLTGLELQRDNDDKTPINFDFVSKLSLQWLYVHLCLSLESLDSLIRSSRSTRCFFYLRFKEHLFCIRKRKIPNVWIVENFSRTLFETENADLVVDFFENLKCSSEAELNHLTVARSSCNQISL